MRQFEQNKFLFIFKLNPEFSTESRFRRGQSNLSTDFTFISWEEKYYYCVVSNWLPVVLQAQARYTRQGRQREPGIEVDLSPFTFSLSFIAFWFLTSLTFLLPSFLALFLLSFSSVFCFLVFFFYFPFLNTFRSKMKPEVEKAMTRQPEVKWWLVTLWPEGTWFLIFLLLSMRCRTKEQHLASE